MRLEKKRGMRLDKSGEYPSDLGIANTAIKNNRQPKKSPINKADFLVIFFLVPFISGYLKMVNNFLQIM